MLIKDPGNQFFLEKKMEVGISLLYTLSPTWASCSHHGPRYHRGNAQRSHYRVWVQLLSTNAFVIFIKTEEKKSWSPLVGDLYDPQTTAGFWLETSMLGLSLKERFQPSEPSLETLYRSLPATWHISESKECRGTRES